MYTDSLEPEGHEALDRRGIPKKRIEYLLPSTSKNYDQDVRFYDCWSTCFPPHLLLGLFAKLTSTRTGKLQPFSLIEYERVVQLDSDMVVLQNMDELMDIPLDITGNRVFAASSACVCNPMNKKHYPADWIPSNCGFTFQHANPAAAATEGAPPDFGLGILNGGLQVVQPSMDLYNQILATMNNPEATNSYDFADQSLLSDTFRGRWVPLSYKYNALKTLRWCHKEIWRDEDVKNVHYILSPKPWESRESDDETHKWWWDMNDRRLAKEKAMGIEVDGW